MNLTIPSTPFSSRNINANFTKYRYGEQSLKRRGTGFNDKKHLNKSASRQGPQSLNDSNGNSETFVLKTRFLKSPVSTKKGKIHVNRGNHFYYGREGILSPKHQMQ